MLVAHSQQKSRYNKAFASFYDDITISHLPYKDLQTLSMDAGIADLDLDGDPDVLIANEHNPNILLINNGKGIFTNESSTRIPQIAFYQNSQTLYYPHKKNITIQ